MNFDKLNQMIPYVMGGKPKVLTMHPYNAITLAMPGRHGKDTTPVGGDFVVMVDDENKDWTKHQFTHDDIFLDLQDKFAFNQSHQLLHNYLKVVHEGLDPEKVEVADDYPYVGVHPKTFLYAVQCLAVAEHRRYAHFEQKFGGRYLPLRFASGIVEGLWTATDAMAWQRKGRPGVERLEKEFGTPLTTARLFDSVSA
jgi:hypothetical protein